MSINFEKSLKYWEVIIAVYYGIFIIMDDLAKFQINLIAKEGLFSSLTLLKGCYYQYLIVNAYWLLDSYLQLRFPFPYLHSLIKNKSATIIATLYFQVRINS